MTGSTNDATSNSDAQSTNGPRTAEDELRNIEASIAALKHHLANSPATVPNGSNGFNEPTDEQRHIKCTICQDAFNTTDRCLKHLLCGHMMCAACVTRQYNARNTDSYKIPEASSTVPKKNAKRSTRHEANQTRISRCFLTGSPKPGMTVCIKHSGLSTAYAVQTGTPMNSPTDFERYIR
ncbi:hypothetical protein AAVH_02516 [Aphelenchoides avenae]|nr:hypothetical protein AAVH_02516 [Aphelenchus avenae]